jgi:hypothetical protein
LNTTTVKISLSIIISKTVYLNFFSVNIIAYIRDDMQAKGYMKFQVGGFNDYNLNNYTTYTYFTGNNLALANTMFLGLKQFHIIN